MRESALEPGDHFLADLRHCGLEVRKWDLQLSGAPALDTQCASRTDKMPTSRYDSWSDGSIGLFISDIEGATQAFVESVALNSFLAIDLPYPGRSSGGVKGMINQQGIELHPNRSTPFRDFASLCYLNPTDKLEARLNEKGMRSAILLVGSEILSNICNSSIGYITNFLTEIQKSDDKKHFHIELPRDVSWRIQNLINRRPRENLSILYYQAFAAEMAWSILSHIAECGDGLSSMGIPKQRIDRLEQVRSLIEENPSQSRSIEELTRIACMNRTTLRDLFKRVYGTTISDYRTELLMRRAMSMIIEDDLPISEITFLLGYSDAANLSVAFKRFHGAPPGAFRRKAEAYN